ncbi:MAG: hypothetical protein WAM79_10370 [Candidatus Sulfotelmatobacter sp.]
MRKPCFRSIGLCWLVGLLTAATVWAQQTPSAGTSVHLVVTAEAHKGNNPPEVKKEDVMVYEGKTRDTVTDWIPATGDHAALELFILVDDSSNSSLGSQLQDIKQFIGSQPETTKIGVAYMQNGIARVAENLTDDHDAAAKALRLPMGIGGANASPYFSLSDLVKRWPASNARREVLMISDGIDLYYGMWDLEDPYLQSAIDDAGKAGIIVSCIYTPGAGHFAHSYWESYWGQLYLADLAEKTGGEAYYIGFNGPPVSFAPYLDSLSQRLQHQYFLGFLAQPRKKAGWQHIRLTTELPGVDLVSAGRVYVPAQQ